MAVDLGESIWSRRGGEDTLSPRLYVGATTLSTCYGLIVTALIATFLVNWAPTTIIPFLIAGLVVPFVGIFIAAASDEPLVSFIGYNMVVGGFGLILGPVVHQYQAGIVLQAVFATGGVTLAMSMVGILYPKSLSHWGGWLFAGLIGLILVHVAALVLAAFGIAPGILSSPIISYFAVVLFSAYIIYDWNRALRLPHTLDNAIDCSLAIYLDIINLFIHLLNIMNNNSSNSS